MTASLISRIQLVCILGGLGALLPDAGYAQVYTWKDSLTGSARMSNIPPPWYKGNVQDRNAGPRTVVTFGLEVLDDSAKRIDENEYEQVRKNISARRAPPSQVVAPLPPDSKESASQQSSGPGVSTPDSSREMSTKEAKSPGRPLTAAEQARLDEIEDREEMAKERGLQPR
jgi:hypothetical protein